MSKRVATFREMSEHALRMLAKTTAKFCSQQAKADPKAPGADMVMAVEVALMRLAAFMHLTLTATATRDEFLARAGEIYDYEIEDRAAGRRGHGQNAGEVSGRNPMRESNALVIWTVYAYPRDYPNKYVARKTLVPGGVTDDMFVADSLAEVRALLPVGLYRMPPQAGDDRVIVETWL